MEEKLSSAGELEIKNIKELNTIITNALVGSRQETVMNTNQKKNKMESKNRETIRRKKLSAQYR